MKRSLGCVGLLAFAFGPVFGQTHKVAKTEDIVRAIGVYEWTGDMAKPTASRLIPVSLFLNGKLEDAAVYMARPVPLALLTGNVYELDTAGVSHGVLDLAYARHLVASETATTTYDDGWFGYGNYVAPKPPVVKRPTTALRPARTTGIVGGADPDRPSFSKKSATPGSGEAATPAPGATASAETPADDPDRPTLKRGTGSSSQPASSTSSGDSASSAPSADPDRPTLTRHTDSTATSDSTASTTSPASSTSTTPAASTQSSRDSDASSDDPDRPTLRRRTPEQAKSAKNARDQGGVTAIGSPSDDPDRPSLHHGAPAAIPTEAQFAKLSGLPEDLHQMVAVSDAANRPVHDFAQAWEDDAQRQTILGKMEEVARAQLKIYSAATYAPAAKPAPTPTAPGRPNSKLRRGNGADTPPPPPEPLLDEQLKAYTLSYGGAATYVYTAHTGGQGADLRYVTLVAQVDMQGAPQIAMKSVTDAMHLDRTPRMRLVDVVDAEASNRASLLFEMRGMSSRQFALYRVIGARAELTFETGTTM